MSIVTDHVRPSMTTVGHLLMATSSRMMHHVTKLNTTVVPLGCGGPGDTRLVDVQPINQSAGTAR